MNQDNKKLESPKYEEGTFIKQETFVENTMGTLNIPMTSSRIERKETFTSFFRKGFTRMKFLGTTHKTRKVEFSPQNPPEMSEYKTCSNSRGNDPIFAPIVTNSTINVILTRSGHKKIKNKNSKALDFENAESKCSRINTLSKSLQFSSPNSCFLKWIFLIIIIIFCLSNLGLTISITILSLNKVNPTENIASTLKQFTNNLDGQPLLDLTITPYGMCPLGYNKIPLGDWPGTKKGCYCSDNTLTSGGCQANMKDCQTIPAQPSCSLLNWNRYQFCGYFSKEYKKSDNCGNGYILCHSGGCYSEDEGCPITGISLDNKGNLLLTREFFDTPIIALNISLDGVPCYSTITQQTNRIFYPLWQNLNLVGCPDNIFMTNYSIARESALNIFGANGLNSTASFLPEFTRILSNSTAYLYVQKKYSFLETPSCSNIESDCFNKINDIIPKYIYESRLLSELSLISFLFFFISLLFQFLYYLKNSNFKKRYSILSGFIGFLALLVSLAHLIIQFLYHNGTAECDSYVNNMLNNGCFITTNEKLQAKMMVFRNLWIEMSYDIYRVSIAYGSLNLFFIPLILIVIYKKFICSNIIDASINKGETNNYS